jgi:hypothetical protein
MVDGFGISGIQQHSTIVMLSEAKDHCTFAPRQIAQALRFALHDKYIEGN